MFHRIQSIHPSIHPSIANIHPSHPPIASIVLGDTEKLCPSCWEGEANKWLDVSSTTGRHKKGKVCHPPFAPHSIPTHLTFFTHPFAGEDRSQSPAEAEEDIKCELLPPLHPVTPSPHPHTP